MDVFPSLWPTMPVIRVTSRIFCCVLVCRTVLPVAVCSSPLFVLNQLDLCFAPSHRFRLNDLNSLQKDGPS